MKAQKRGTYTLKTYSADLYTWKPQDTNQKVVAGRPVPKSYCTATPRSQGEDWVVTYVYDIVVDSSGVQKRMAYVACDYVQ